MFPFGVGETWFVGDVLSFVFAYGVGEVLHLGNCSLRWCSGPTPPLIPLLEGGDCLFILINIKYFKKCLKINMSHLKILT